MDRIAIIGYSGHAFVVLDNCKKVGLSVPFYCDRTEVKHSTPYQLTYLGDERVNSFDWNKIDKFVLGIGHNCIRMKVTERNRNAGKKILTVIHSSAIVNDFVEIGEASFLSSNCVINTGAIIEHECVLGDSVHISPGAVLADNVTIGTGSFIGANSVIKEGVAIGEKVVMSDWFRSY